MITDRVLYKELMHEIMVVAGAEKKTEKYLLKCFSIIGQNLALSRVYYFHYDKETDSVFNTIEWTSVGVSEQKKELQGISVDRIKRFVSDLKSNKIFKYTDIREVPDKNTKMILDMQHIKSIIVIPVFVSGNFSGFVGFDQCDSIREWSDFDEFILDTLAIMSAQSIKENELKNELQLEREQLLTLVDNIGGLSYAIDVDTYEIIFANIELKKLYNHNLEGEICYKALQGKNNPCDFCTNSKILDSTEPYKWDYYNSYLNKSFYLIDRMIKMPDGKKVRFEIGFDISKQKEYEKKLFEEKERLSVTLKSIGDGVITTDKYGNVVLLNTISEELTGWKSCDAEGKRLEAVFNIVNEITGDKCENPVDKVLASGNIVELANHTCLISRTGEIYVIEDSAAPIRNHDNEIIGVVLVFRDTTEKQKINNSLIRNQKLESLSVLAGGIAHDFNNLLSGVFGYLELAKDCDKDDRDLQNEYLSKSLEVFDRAKSLTNQLLTFSKGGTLKRERIYLTPLIKSSVKFALSGSKISPYFNIDKNLDYCDCDKNQIQQCIDNIIINSMQAMPNGGVITVVAENIELCSCECHNHKLNGKYIKISIKDTGPGIDPSIVERVFDPFFTTKETGHGLGLSTVFSIVQHHDGEIEVKSKIGNGTETNIYLPASKGFKSIPENNTGAFHKSNGKILIMDDEVFNVDILEKMLGKMGYEVVTSYHGDEAVQKILDTVADRNNYFKAAILDLTIPGGKGGKYVSDFFQNMMPDTKLFAATGYSDDPVISSPEEHGFNDGIVKPFKIDDLSEMLNKHFDE